ncbi:MAG: YciI family protein [Alphaproteobacteria bacterium]|nr:YciI family protein [Alphaproteobacteria bacterium]
MLFVIYAKDKPGDGSARLAHRAEHLEYLKSQSAMLKTAGPLLTDDGATMTGSMLVVEAADRAGAERFAAGDPFRKHGVFASVEIHAWRASIGSVSFA